MLLECVVVGCVDVADDTVGKNEECRWRGIISTISEDRIGRKTGRLEGGRRARYVGREAGREREGGSISCWG